MFSFLQDKKRQESKYFEKSSRSEVTECEVCAQPFGLLNRQHKCKRCRRYVCSGCGMNKTMILGIDYESGKEHRTCKCCMADIISMDVFIQKHGLRWGESSQVMVDWLHPHQKTVQEHFGREWSYGDYLALFNSKSQSHFQQDSLQIEKDVSTGRTSILVFNYSQAQFLHKLQGSLSQQKYQESVTNVLKALCVIFPSAGYCQGMNMVVAYLLSFGTEEQAFWLYVIIIHLILPPHFYQQSLNGVALPGFQMEKKVILQLCSDFFLKEHKEKEIQLMRDYLQIKLPRFLLNLMTDSLQFEPTFYILNHMMEEKSIRVLEEAVLLACQEMVSTMTHCIYTSDQLTDQVCRNIHLSQLKKVHEQVHDQSSPLPFLIHPQRRQQIITHSIQDDAHQWSLQKSIIYHKLKKCTLLSTDEISAYQTQFNQILTDESLPGLNGSLFKRILGDILQKSECQLDLQDQELEQLFLSFDQDRNGYLDFREFISIVSMLQKGDISIKLELLFKIFDSDQKGFLEEAQYQEFIKCLLGSIRFNATDIEMINYQKEAFDFYQRAGTKIQNGKVFIQDVKDLIQDSFMIKIQSFIDNSLRKDEEKQEIMEQLTQDI